MESQEKIETLQINGVEYVRKDTIPFKPIGNRAVVVVDRGWIFAGDVTREKGRIKLSRALHVRRWESIGFDGMIANPNSSKVTLVSVPDVEIPEQSEIFCIPVSEIWGVR